MDTMRSLLFENSLYTYLGLGFAQIVLVAIWYERRTRRTAWLMLVPPVLAGAVLLLSAVVQTDREQIISAAAEVASDVQNDRTEALQKYLHPSFRGAYLGGEVDKELALTLCGQEKRNYRISRIDIGSPQVDVRGAFADMTAPTVMTISSSEFGMSQGVSVEFRLKWKKMPEGWRILSADEPRMKLK